VSLLPRSTKDNQGAFVILVAEREGFDDFVAVFWSLISVYEIMMNQG